MSRVYSATTLATTMRQRPCFGPVLDIALKYRDPLTNETGTSGAGCNTSGEPLRPSLARATIPAIWSASHLDMEPSELGAVIDGFDAEDLGELSDALGAHPDYIDAVRFGHNVAVALGLTADHSYFNTVDDFRATTGPGPTDPTTIETK